MLYFSHHENRLHKPYEYGNADYWNYFYTHIHHIVERM